MSPEQDRLQKIFTEALAKALPEERERYLADACGQDAELRRQLDSLLEAHTQSGDFLRQNVITPNGPPIGEGPGSVVGRYKLLQQIGQGGFGVVFMAEQQEPMRRMVALKILKPGMDTKEVVARFEVGRQALALMDHPNIARVLDGGATESGRPYFVMELVKGIPITEFCDHHQLPVEERLRLFIKVCAGVQHAHQKGVIHRDIKPSNVLVTLHDGEAVPKVIDFGIAKAIGQKLTERTLFTHYEQLLGTPAYMSPEQAKWSGIDIDTRSDEYSLGVLLYELLTGTTPIERETLARAALDEVRRMIREVDPPKPSTRLTNKAAAKSAPDISHSRLQKVRGDLDWIVMKALEKDRTRRYETVNGLARDIERHLNGEPVAACPPSRAYLTGKFIRKHRTAVSAASSVGLALLAGLAFALVGFAQARQERQLAQNEAERVKKLSAFLTEDLLGHADPDPQSLSLRAALDWANEKIDERFAEEPLLEASTRASVGNMYLALSDFANATNNFERCLKILRQQYGPGDRRTLSYTEFVADSYGRIGSWEPCAGLCREILRFTETDSAFWCFRGGVASLLAGDTNAYRKLAAWGLGRFAGTTNKFVAQHIGTLCLIAPFSVTDLQPVFKLGDLVRNDTGEGILFRGMMEYRRGNLSVALKCFNRWTNLPVPDPFFCAMIHYRQGNVATAKDELARAVRNLEKFTYPRSHWTELAVTLAVRSEAELLILGREVSPRIDTAWFESESQRRALPSEPRSKLEQADSLGAQGRWSQACDRYLAVLQEREFSWLDESPQRMGIVFLLADDRRSFEKLCGEWFTWLENNPDPESSYFAVRTFLAGEPDLGTDLGRRAFKFFSEAALKQDPEASSWLRAMISYRLGQYGTAIREAQLAQSSKRLATRSAAQIIRAMALAKSGQLDESRSVLSQVEAQLRGHLAALRGDFWWDLALCQISLREAHALFRPAK